MGFTVVCSALGTQGSEAKVSSEPSGVTRAPVGSASTEGLQSSQGGDEELEIDEEHQVEHFSHGTTRKALLKVKTECVTCTSICYECDGETKIQNASLRNSCCLAALVSFSHFSHFSSVHGRLNSELNDQDFYF